MARRVKAFAKPGGLSSFPRTGHGGQNQSERKYSKILTVMAYTDTVLCARHDSNCENA